MSTPPSAEKKTLPDDPLVTSPASSVSRDEQHLSTPKRPSDIVRQQQDQESVPSPSRAESPSARQWSIPPAGSSALIQQKKDGKNQGDTERLARSGRLYSPQLSERDSIFATNYLPSDNEPHPLSASSPGDDTPRTSFQGTTTPTTVDLSTSKVSLISPDETVPRTDVDASGVSPALSPPLSSHAALLRATTTGAEDQNQVSTDHSVKELSAPGRSHDLAGPDAPVAPEDTRGSSRGDDHEMMPHQRPRRSSSLSRRGLVGSSIEANLENAKPASNVRSRKASHYLGLFKENTTSSPERKRKDDPHRSVKHDEPLDPSSHESTSEVLPGAGAWTSGEGVGVGARRSSKSLFRPSLATDVPMAIDPPTSETNENNDDLPQIQQTDDLVKYQYRPLPCSLLEEIRNFHLTPGGARGKSFSKSIPTQYTDGHLDLYDQQQESADADSPMSDTLAEQRRGSGQYEDDEEEKEQISSALYFPHERVAVPDDVDPYRAHDGGEQNAGIQPFEISADEAGSVLVSGNGHDLPGEQEVSHVDISLRSKNDSRVLHGHIQDLQGPLDELNDTTGPTTKPLTTISERSPDSTCESEVPSADESGMSTHEESSLTEDDGATMTPTATPIQRNRYLRHERKHSKAAPVGAVELKPYRHQVGGHTTVFRFSRRAVCKQLNNRENEFYERIERRHPEMLMFLPRCVDLKPKHLCCVSPFVLPSFLPSFLSFQFVLLSTDKKRFLVCIDISAF